MSSPFRFAEPSTRPGSPALSSTVGRGPVFIRLARGPTDEQDTFPIPIKDTNIFASRPFDQSTVNFTKAPPAPPPSRNTTRTKTVQGDPDWDHKNAELKAVLAGHVLSGVRRPRLALPPGGEPDDDRRIRVVTRRKAVANLLVRSSW
jgi:hypothetical protein